MLDVTTRSNLPTGKIFDMIKLIKHTISFDYFQTRSHEDGSG